MFESLTIIYIAVDKVKSVGVTFELPVPWAVICSHPGNEGHWDLSSSRFHQSRTKFLGNIFCYYSALPQEM
jgi:hypothetical protein